MTAEYARLVAKRYRTLSAIKTGSHIPSFLVVVLYPLIADAMYRGLQTMIWNGWWIEPVITALRKDGFIVRHSDNLRDRRLVISWADGATTGPIKPIEAAPAAEPADYAG